MNTASVSTTMTEIQGVADMVLKTIEAVDPAVGVPVATAGAVVDLIASLISKAVTAWSAASNTPITVDTLKALLPDATPLTPPTVQG
jgi:hypothetical protein